MEGLLPKFVVIGAQRAGTTWLYECLKEHPDVFLPDTKELHFFDHHFDKGESYYRRFFPDTVKESYESWGEITPNYYQEPQALERLQSVIPDCKVIFILREPVSRLISQYELFSQSDYKDLSFDDVIQNKPSVIDLSLQGKHLNRALKLFGKDNVYTCFYDDLSTTPLSFFQSICKFIGVNSSFEPFFINKRVNRVVLPRTQAALKAIGLGKAIDFVKSSRYSESIKEIFHNRPSPKGKRFTLQQHVLDELAEDVTLIESITHKRLDNWKTKYKK